MPDSVEIQAALQVEETGGAVRRLRTVDLNQLPPGASTEVSLAEAVDRLTQVVAQLAGAATEVTLAAVRDRASFPLPAAQLITLTPSPAISGFATEVTAAAVRDRLPTALADDGSLPTKDTYTTDEALASQAGANAVLTFTFAAPMDLLWVRSEGGTSFARITGDPALGAGIYCEDGVPQPITRRTSTVKVWAPAGATVFCWGYGG